MSTPLPLGLKLPSLSDIRDTIVIDKYRKLLGKLLYLSRCSRYDIFYAVNLLSRYSTNHNKSIKFNLKGILKYLKSSTFKISYCYNKKSPDVSSELAVWRDFSFADDFTTRKSTIGYFFLEWINCCLELLQDQELNSKYHRI